MSVEMIEIKIIASIAAAWSTWLSYIIAHKNFLWLGGEETGFLFWNIFLFAIICMGVWK